MPRRAVRRSEAFLREARLLFPPGGSADGRPSFEQFENGPLAAAETAFGLGFETMTQPLPGTPSIRFVLLAPTPIFTPILIWGLLVDDGSPHGCVSLVSVSEDPDYWEMIEGDPTD